MEERGANVRFWGPAGMTKKRVSLSDISSGEMTPKPQPDNVGKFPFGKLESDRRMEKQLPG